MKLKKAFELSILKWESIINNNGEYNHNLFPNKIKELQNTCGLCELYFKYHCYNCPLMPKYSDCDVGCYHSTHPYNKWEQNTTKQNAQKVLNLIKKKYNKYLDKTQCIKT